MIMDLEGVRMKMHLYKDERYPDYTLVEPDKLDEANVDVPEELYERYKRVFDEYNAVQLELTRLEKFWEG